MNEKRFVDEIFKTYDKNRKEKGLPYGELLREYDKQVIFNQIVMAKRLPPDFFDPNVDSTLVARDWARGIVRGEIDFFINRFSDYVKENNMVESVKKISSIEELIKLISDCEDDGFIVTDIFFKSREMFSLLYSRTDLLAFNPDRLNYGPRWINLHLLWGGSPLDENHIMLVDYDNINWYQKETKDMLPINDNENLRKTKISTHKFLDIQKSKSEGKYSIFIRTVLSLEFNTNSGKIIKFK